MTEVIWNAVTAGVEFGLALGYLVFIITGAGSPWLLFVVGFSILAGIWFVFEARHAARLYNKKYARNPYFIVNGDQDR